MARKNFVRDNVPLSRFGVLVAQLESIVASAAQQSPDPLLCFDLLSDLISAIDEEPKDSISLWQRKCEDTLYSLLVLGARRPVRHLASVATAKIISKGDPISIYSRASSLQGFLSDGRKNEPQQVAGAALCLGELYRLFGRRITSGLSETTSIVSKLMKYHEEYVRKEAFYLLQNALEGCGGNAAAAAYTDAFRIIMRFGVGDKSFIVRKAAARCLTAFANVGGPGLAITELENAATSCVKAIDDPTSSVRDAFAEALGTLLALGMNPEAQVQPRGKGQFIPAKKLEGGLQRHLVSPFVKASGVRLIELRIGLTLAWVSFLQAILLKYLHPDGELQDFALQVIDMLRVDTSVDAQALACVLYILRVGVTDQMTEPIQRSFSVTLGKQLQSPDSSPSMKVAALRTLSYTLKTLGEVPGEFREVLDDTVVAALSHSSQLVRIEAALTLRALAEVDPTCVGGLISFGVTTLTALRENISFEKGPNFRVELDSLHGQANLLAALISISQNLPLGYPARLPKSVLEVSKKLLAESTRNPVAAAVEKEAAWLLLSSLLASIPREEFEDQVFDILTLWAPLFTGNAEVELQQSGDLASKISVRSVAIEALTAFIRCYVSPHGGDNTILLQPMLVYLSSALSYISFIAAKELPDTRTAIDVFTIRTLIAFQSLSDPMAYRSDHSKILHICTTPFRNASAYEESSCLRVLLDKRDSWLGPWIPGRDWFEDELRAFQGGRDSLMPCVWDRDMPSFPQPETIRQMLVNQMLLCFGILFAFQDSSEMLSLLGVIEQCLRAGRKQSWHAASVTNICVGLLAGLKACLSFHPQPLGSEILNSLQAIFQSILAEGDIAASLRRASAEGLGLLTRLGNDAFTASMTKSLLGDLTGQTDVNYTGSIALALGCIHRSAGGMALSSLVPATVSSISLLAKCSVAALQIWSLHGLLLTIEAAGLSYVSHVQATLSLALEILLAEENGWVDLQHGVGRLINAIVAALGPELAPGSIFFSRCRSVIAEISSYQETATLLERVRFTQQLVLFAPHALSVHSHVQTLLPTLSSRQPTLRHLAISTLRHLIEKDPVSVIGEHIEENLFHMLDEETDAEIGNLVRSTIMRLLYASCPMSPSHWIAICRKMVLAISTRNVEVNNGSQHEKVNNLDSDSRLDLGEDDENMVSSSTSTRNQGYASDASSVNLKREKHLRYRTRVFAAECSSHLPNAVGMDPAHFDLSLARKPKGQASGDWLVLQLQDLLSLAYQISTIQFESMQPIGIGLLSTIIDKFEGVPDPELPGHLLLEQYQAQLMSALRSALSASSGPVLLEAGLQLATKILTSGIIRGDQVAVKRIFALISRPLNDFNELYYPSFAEWVSGKIKMRLLAAHASLKCYTYKNLRGQPMEVPDEYTTLLSLISQNSSILAKHWIWILKDYCHVCFNQHLRKDWRPFLDGVQSPVVSSKLRPCLEEAWPLILQALALDAVPPNFNMNGTSDGTGNNMMPRDLISGYKMVELELEEFRFLWGFALLIIFQGKNPTNNEQRLQLSICKAKNGGESPRDPKSPTLKIHDIVLPVFQSLCTERFFRVGFLTVDICRELIQVFTCLGRQGGLWNGLVITVLAQILQNCPEDFLKLDSFAFLAMEICLAYLDYVIQRADATVPEGCSSKDLLPQLVIATRTLLHNIEPKMQPKAILAFMLAGYKCARVSSTELSFSKTNELVLSTSGFLKLFIDDKSDVDDADTIRIFQKIIGACQNATGSFIEDCIESIHILENKKSSLRRLVHTKLAFCLEQTLFLADIAYKTRLRKKNCISFLNWAIFKDCIRCLRIVLADGNIQVQAIGLQVLRNTVQKSMTAKDDFFMVILIGELLGDILLIIKKMLKKPASRESVALAGECLKTLVLMQTLPSEDDCQKALMNLILEVIFMVLSETDSGPYEQGSNEIRSGAVRLVSQLAQIPTAAVHIKNSLLGMPAMHREQIQGIIRASVAQEHNTQQVNPTVPNLEIKLPRQSEENREENCPAAPAPQSNEEFEDEEDDWDTFQSFPASTDTAPEKSDLDSEDPGSSEPNFGNNDSKNGPESNSIGSESCETHDHGSEERELGQNSGPPLAYSMKSVGDANESTEVSETTENVLTEENTGFEDLDHVPSSEINIIGQRQTGTSSQDSSTELELFSGDIKNEEHQGISQTSALSEEQHTTESVSNDQLQEIHESL